MPKTIDTLIADVEALFENGHLCSDEHVAELGQALATTIARRLKEASEGERKFSLRMSAIGRPDRQLWYDAHAKGEPEKLPVNTRIKFLFGDILEHMLLFLAKEAGHEVTEEQAEVVVNGVKGHKDCKIDGVTVDTKSASTMSYRKFKDGTLRSDDSFGYMWQIAGYTHGTGDPGAFWVIDKTLGNMCLLQVPVEELALYNVPQRIEEQKAVVASDVPPERCYDDVPDGKSGNMKLATGCAYCKHKEECWPGLRTFIYSNGPRFLTKVERLPDVPEANKNNKVEEEENG